MCPRLTSSTQSLCICLPGIRTADTGHEAQLSLLLELGERIKWLLPFMQRSFRGTHFGFSWVDSLTLREDVWLILCKSPRRFSKWLHPFPLVQQRENVLCPLSAQMALTRLLSSNAQLPSHDFPCHPFGTHRHGSYSQVAFRLSSRHLFCTT